MKNSAFASGLVVALLAGGAAMAHEVKHGGISIRHPWTMESAGGAPRDVVVSMTVRNREKVSDRLMAVRCAAAENAELALSDGTPAGPIEVKAGGELVMSAAGPRIILKGVTAALSAYDMLPMTLVFEKAGEMAIEVMVEER